ncbi:FAD-dependent oxidoreductase [Chloroflexota bacterium]
MSKKALIMGGNIENIEVALSLADVGIEVTLLESSPALCSNHISNPGRQFETLRFVPKLLKAANHRNIRIVTNASVKQVKGDKYDFRVTVQEYPRYVSLDECTSCGRCERDCPVDIIPPAADVHTGYKAIHRPDFGLKSVPSTYCIDKRGIAPCTAACPAGINAHGYVALIAKGKFTEALDLITKSAPFPRVLGRVCHHPCESKCTRGKIDEAVSICALKRFAANSDFTEASLRRALDNGIRPTGPPTVAIIGAGPAGLTAARDLAQLGYRSTIFEALPVAGGMISVGMPRFRLPREVRQADIDDILKMGIEIRTSTPIGPELTLQDLQNQGYKAILIATGAHKNQRLGIAGENLAGVINSIAFLRSLNLKESVTIGSKVAVIGGGYTAIDSARTAIRLHCDQVLILYRRSLEEMPSNPDEVAEARDEGVDIEYLVAPVRIVGQGGRVVGIDCIRMALGESDKSGRRRPIPIEGSEFFIEVDTVIVAVGQKPDLSFIEEDITITESRGHIVVDHHTMATQSPGIFAAGDVAGEPAPMISAIADGRRAAVSIDKYLGGDGLKKEYTKRKEAPVEVNLDEIFIPSVEHQQMPSLLPAARIGNFEEVELGFNTETAIREANRCLNCAGCSECLECERACELKAINHKQLPQSFELEADVIIATSNHTQERHGVYLIDSLSDNSDLSHVSKTIDSLIAELTDGSATNQTVSSNNTIGPVIGYQNRSAPSGLDPRIGVFVCECGGSISKIIDVPDVIKSYKELDTIAHGSRLGYACTSEAAEEIKDAVRQHNLTHVVLAGCACCHFDQICFSCSDRRLRCKSNLLNSGQPDDTIYEFVNIREHCAWVHYSQPEEATAKARSLIGAGVSRVRDIFSTGSVIAVVDQSRCRGCGTCVSVCPFVAVTLKERKSSVLISQINEELCRGCGICVAHCPSGAILQNSCSDNQIVASLEALLS